MSDESVGCIPPTITPIGVSGGAVAAIVIVLLLVVVLAVAVVIVILWLRKRSGEFVLFQTEIYLGYRL